MCVQVGQICHERGPHSKRPRASLSVRLPRETPSCFHVSLFSLFFFSFCGKISGLKATTSQVAKEFQLLKRNIVIKEDNFFVFFVFSGFIRRLHLPTLESRLHNKFFSILYIYRKHVTIRLTQTNRQKEKKEEKWQLLKYFSIRPLLFFIFYSTARMLSKCSFSFISDIESWRHLRNHFLALPGS